MNAQLEVPQLADLADLPVDVVSDSAGVVSVTTWANDGDVVTVSWDEIAGSVNVRWLEGDDERLVLERETVSKVSIREEQGQVQFWIRSDAAGLGGQLVVRVSEHVMVSDAILRKLQE